MRGIGAFYIFVLGVVLSAASGVQGQDCWNNGDVTQDLVITAGDAQVAFFITLGVYTPTYEEECAADCNGDENVTAGDAQGIFLVVLGLGECTDPLLTPTPVPTETPATTPTETPTEIPTPVFVSVGNMISISAGTFMQGSPSTEPCRNDNESQFDHTLTLNLSVMETEVTRQMWADLRAMQPTLPVDPSNTTYSPTLSHPVQYNTWYEAVLFANLLSLQNGYIPCYYKDAEFTTPVDVTNYSDGSFYCNFNVNGYRLPNEGEWEYFARAGTSGPLSVTEPNYSSDTCGTCSPSPELTELNSVAWWCGNASDTAHPAGTKAANPWNLKDVHGNVWEWCWDWYATYPSGSATDYTGPASGTNRVKRGGCWDYNANYCRSANRPYDIPGYRGYDIGFRLLRTIY